MPLQAGTAIVIGGSMAGLLAVRVLSDEFAQVILIERDELPEAAVQRKGVPQGNHAHALLGRGRQALETFFPGLTDTLVAQGAPLGRGRFFAGGGYFARPRQGVPILFVSRPCLEAEVRGRVRQLPNVQVQTGCDVVGLLADDNRRITGVRVQQRGPGRNAAELSADLIVDASGRGSRVPQWLEALGYAKPEVERVEVDVAYTSRIYQRVPTHLNGDLNILVVGTPQDTRGCAVNAQEGDRWMVTLINYFGDEPPKDEAGFMAFARTLPTPDVYDLLSQATPLTDLVSFTFPANQRRRYERLTNFPEGLVVTGDALCCFSPSYGQGMTVAAMEAEVLQQCLATGRQNLPQRYFEQVSKVIDMPWETAVHTDRQLAGERGSLFTRLFNRYIAQLLRVAHHDPEVALAYFMVIGLFRPRASLLRPRTLLRVLRGSLRAGAATTTAAADPNQAPATATGKIHSRV